MRIALATCRDLPDWEVDDRPLHEALGRRGLDLVRPAWDDARFDWAGCDACLIRTTWDYMERRDEYVNWAERVAGRTRLFNSAEIVRWNTSKTYLYDLEQRGAPVIPTVWLKRGDSTDLAAILRERNWSRGFIKPVIGATARETRRLNADAAGAADGQRHLDRMLLSEDMMVQPYLATVETQGEISVIMIDGQVSHCVRKVPVKGDYRVQDDFGAHDEPIALPDAVKALAMRIVSMVDGDLLYARADFLHDGFGDVRMNEMELVEPSMFFRHAPNAGERLAAALCRRIARTPHPLRATP